MTTPSLPDTAPESPQEGSTQAILTITDNAKKHIILAIEDEGRDDLAVRVAIVARRGPGGFQYKMDLVDQDERMEGDTVLDLGDFEVWIDQESVPDLTGATIDFVQKLQEAGFKFHNPNSPWQSPVAIEVQRIIDEQINPQIASHGGFITLLDVKENDVYISMGGGCQGCGMADVTLREGVETMIKDAVPAVENIYDQTDHAAGDNPYY